MEKERAKSFLLDEIYTCNKIYLSKDLQKLLDKANNRLTNIYAIIETENGEILCDMDWMYSGEPFIADRFMHKDSFLEFYCDIETIDLDK